MIAMTPLEQALVAWRRDPNAPDARQTQFDDAVALGETGVFSNRNISHITGLNPDTVLKLTGKTERTGGRLSPESLPFLLDAAQHFAQYGLCLTSAVRVSARLGTSWRMIATLTGIPRSTAHSHGRIE